MVEIISYSGSMGGDSLPGICTAILSYWSSMLNISQVWLHGSYINRSWTQPVPVCHTLWTSAIITEASQDVYRQLNFQCTCQVGLYYNTKMQCWSKVPMLRKNVEPTQSYFRIWSILYIILSGLPTSFLSGLPTEIQPKWVFCLKIMTWAPLPNEASNAPGSTGYIYLLFPKFPWFTYVWIW